MDGGASDFGFEQKQKSRTKRKMKNLRIRNHRFRIVGAALKFRCLQSVKQNKFIVYNCGNRPLGTVLVFCGGVMFCPFCFSSRIVIHRKNVYHCLTCRRYLLDTKAKVVYLPSPEVLSAFGCKPHSSGGCLVSVFKRRPAKGTVKNNKISVNPIVSGA